MLYLIYNLLFSFLEFLLPRSCSSGPITWYMANNSTGVSYIWWLRKFTLKTISQPNSQFCTKWTVLFYILNDNSALYSYLRRKRFKWSCRNKKNEKDNRISSLSCHVSRLTLLCRLQNIGADFPVAKAIWTNTKLTVNESIFIRSILLCQSINQSISYWSVSTAELFFMASCRSWRLKYWYCLSGTTIKILTGKSVDTRVVNFPEI